MDSDDGEAESAVVDSDDRITRLHAVATELQAATEESEIYESMIETAVETLGFDWCAVALEMEGKLEIAHVSESAPVGEETRTFETDEGGMGRSFQNKESWIVDDAFDHKDAKPVRDSIRAGITAPLGDWGVFQGYSAEVAAFDESDLEVADLLAAHATAALDRIERERKLKRRNEQLSKFASLVSHDLRNPLNVAHLKLELASEECNSDYIADATAAINRMEALTEDLLRRAQAGKRVEEFEPVDLAELARACWQTVETADATLVVDTDQTVVADRTRLQQLLENLIRNAIEHGAADADDSSVTVTIGGLERGFYVADDGPGIPEADRDQVFENGYSTAEDGTGFGLAIVADIVDAHDWSVQIVESADGGARFEITDVERT